MAHRAPGEAAFGQLQISLVDQALQRGIGVGQFLERAQQMLGHLPSPLAHGLLAGLQQAMFEALTRATAMIHRAQLRPWSAVNVKSIGRLTFALERRFILYQ
jgi:hypothetical protein